MPRLSIVALLFFVAAAGKSNSPPAYDLTVTIEPDAGSIAVRGTVDVPLESPAATTFKFNLHDSVTITKLLVDGKRATFTFGTVESPFPMPASRGIVVALPAGAGQNRVRMEIEYSGRLKVLPEFGATEDMLHSMDDQVNSRMVELSPLSSWYPQFGFVQPLQVELALSLPQGWISICSGKKLEERIQDGRALTRWSSPKDTAIMILASPNYKKKSLREAGVNIDIYYTRMPEAFIAQEGTQIAGATNLYSTLLGETNIPAGTIKHIYSPKRKGQGKAGMALPGMIVTSEGLTMEALSQDPKFTMFQWIAHEIAHYWWNFGAGQGDWINEAFAEYYSAIAVQKLSSQAEFQAVMADYRKQAGELPAEAPPLATVPIMEPTSFVVRYYKGSLMLDAVRQLMGDAKFFQASREFFQEYTGKPTGTPEFRTFWNARMRDHKDLVDAWLDSHGGPPARN